MKVISQSMKMELRGVLLIRIEMTTPTAIKKAIESA